MRVKDSKNSKTGIMVFRRGALMAGGLLLLSEGTAAWAQTPTRVSTTPLISGSLRVREEAWDWFRPATGSYQNRYSFTGAILRVAAAHTFDKTDVKAEIAAPYLGNLPKNAVAPAPWGALGLGGTYRSVNGSQNGSVFFKQLFVAPRIGGGQTLKAGRFEFSDGGETVPKNASLAWVKRERVAQRMIGPFAWPHVGRSFDGLTYSRSRSAFNLTALAAYPTQGVFDLDGQNTITAARVAYAAATFTQEKGRTSGEQRLFLLAYNDTRKLNKTDNNTLKDQNQIRLYSLGGHILRGGSAGKGAWDALLWGALETGDWGKKDQSAYSYDVEAGYQFGKQANSPWLRAGYYLSSGDSNPTDNKHTTFYAPISTPRIYARTPFYTESNLRDAFVQILYKPVNRVSLRTDYHRLHLASGNDLWYSADGPYQTRPAFGLVGRPAGGKTDLGSLLDFSADWAATPRDTITLYAGQINGGDVVKRIYPTDTKGSFTYLEVTHRF